MKYPCQKRTELLLDYSAAIAKYAKLLAEVHDGIGSILGVEYAHLRKIAERARRMSESAKRILDHHVTVHGCTSALKRVA
jgi:hypothetical protein